MCVEDCRLQELVVVVGKGKLKRATGRTVRFYAPEDRFTQSLAST